MSGGRIFISYRRGVDNGEARSLYYQLERFFDRERLFMDVDDIPVGVDFVEYLDSQVAQCQAMIAVIGRGWLQDVERLHDEEDFVRIELDAALKRGSQIPIVPLLVDGMMLPQRTELPNDLQPLRRRNGVPIRHDTYASTIEARLIPALSKALHEGAVAERRTPKPELAEATAAPFVAQSEEKPVLPEPGTIFRDVNESWCPEMVVIPTGNFMMGSTPEETTRFGVEDMHAKWERPRHNVEIAQPFALARYATTFEEYDAFCDALGREKPRDNKWGRDRRSVINVSWEDASAYCEWLTEKTGHQYRLPSETEWEYACRSGTETAFSFGDVILTDLANYDGNYTAGESEKGEYRQKTLPVDYPGFPSNAFGLHQMHGNVWEWCADDFVDSYESPRQQSPLVLSPRGDNRVLRGGSWIDYPGNLRSADRNKVVPVKRDDNFGFRPAKTLLTA